MSYAGASATISRSEALSEGGKRLRERRRHRLAFGTKAETLARLEPYVTTARILPQQRFTVRAWHDKPQAICRAILDKPWGRRKLIVRSSARAEDGAAGSLAGRFLTRAEIGDATALREAIEAVVASYAPAREGDQVFVQPMVDKVTVSGVLFTRDPATAAPYLVINYDESGDTAAVTGGRGERLHTYVHAKGAPPRRPLVAALADLAEELEALLGNTALDIEFAFDDSGELFLLQVRPLVIPTELAVRSADHRRRLGGIAERIAASMRPHPHLHGSRNIFGIMPDWNPAEIIGVRPRPLALSLYRHLVTNDVWAKQRAAYGYRDVSGAPLLHSFGGLPYIDVRASFNSFLPADLPAPLAGDLVDHYIETLARQPALHDKVEFEIVLSCYSFDIERRSAALAAAGFSAGSRATIVDSLRRLTNRIIRNDGLWTIDAAKVDELERRRRSVLASDLPILDQIYWLLEDCRQFGTLPFAGLARSGFIAIQMLRSLVAEGVLSAADHDAFLASVETVSTEMARDLRTLPRAEFLARYGHLRPGTYDILSPRYDEAPDEYFDGQPAEEAGRAGPGFALSLDQLERLEGELARHRLDQSLLGLFRFIKAGICGREYAKFIFTRNLSDALLLLGRLGEAHGFSRDEMSFVDIQRVADLHSAGGEIKELLRESITRGRARYAETLQITLPPLILDPADVWSFAVPGAEPNFITRKRARGRVRRHDDRHDLAGAIVAIPNADPGFDWIFARGIAAFVTAFGGANSHMAIRANELGIPAVIGAGEAAFRKWAAAGSLLVDCAARRVEML